jgi:hypothetical protein
MRAFIRRCFLLWTLSTLLSAPVRARLSVRQQTRLAAIHMKQDQGLLLIALSGLMSVSRSRHLLPVTGPNQSASLGVASGAGTTTPLGVTPGGGGGLQNTYYGANLPSSADGQIQHNPADESFPGTIMETYDGTIAPAAAGPPCGAADGFPEFACANDAELQARIAPGVLQNGTLLKLTPGVRYSRIIWPAGLTAYAVIQSGSMSGKPPRGERVTAAHASNLAIIETNVAVSPQNPYSDSYCVHVPGGRGYLWMRYVKFECNASRPVIDRMVVLGDILGINSYTAANLATRVVFDQVLCNVDPAVNTVKKFVVAECRYFALLDSTIREMFHGIRNVDSHCVWSGVSDGPIKLINNELNGSSQSFLTGGAGRSAASPIRPMRWEVRRNWLTKSIARKGQFYNVGGGSVQYTAGFCCEHKDMELALWEGNVLQYCWTSYKTGWANSLSNYSAGGQDEQIRDIVIAYNQVLDVGSGFQDYQDNATAHSHERVVYAHNTMDRFNTGQTTGSAREIQCTALSAQMGAMTYVHNSINGASATHLCVNDRGSGQAFTCSAFTFRKMNVRRGSFGFFHSGLSEGNASISVAAPAAFLVFEWNLIIGGTTNPYPINNICPASLANCFTNAAAGNLAIPTDPYNNPPYGGGSELFNAPGANVPFVLTRTAGAVTGVWT